MILGLTLALGQAGLLSRILADDDQRELSYGWGIVVQKGTRIACRNLVALRRVTATVYVEGTERESNMCYSGTVCAHQ
jgi:hypothetical protein